jgi:hypothetical protein
MESMKFPPTARLFTREGHCLVVIQYTRDVAIIVAPEVFLITRRRNGFKFVDKTAYAKTLKIPAREYTAESLLSAVYSRGEIDAVILELYARLPQPIAEEIEEYYGWMPLSALPVVKF